MAIPIRKKSEIDALAKANHLVALTLETVKSHIKPGVTTLELDKIAEDFIRSHGAIPSFKGLYDFPNSVCTSVNSVIIHGIPDQGKLEAGDIVGIDIGVELDGWYGDAAFTAAVGDISEQNQSLIDCARDTLHEAIDSIRAGMRFKELSAVLEESITRRGFVPLRGYCGHGIGRKPHEEPSILNYVEGKPNQGPKIKDGMVFCLEPMICQKSGESKLLEDKWSVVRTDGLTGSHFEHTVAVIDGKAEILSI
jgi:methionyl aminopeptidase